MTHNPAPLPKTKASTVGEGPHVLIIGGGASGVLMAAHLLSQTDITARVTLLEGRNALGRGIAYSTTDPDHLLNTRVHNMSAYPDDPTHFLRWLQDHPEYGDHSPTSFVQRETYGTYLSQLLDPWQSQTAPQRVEVFDSACVKLAEDASGVTAHLATGGTIRGDIAILATGHVLPEPDAEGLLTSAWDHAAPVAPDDRVVIIGTGLSMVDQVLSLLKRGHRGEIVSISRRGLLPRAHTATTPMKIDEAEIPQDGSFVTLFRWARALARKAEAEGGSWRDAIDGIRPHARMIWRSAPRDMRKRFLRHAAAWWDVHRHRIPPASEARISQAMRSGQLKVQRAAFLRAERAPDGQLFAHIESRDAGAPKRLEAGRIIDCRGIRRDPVRNAQPVMADLFARGVARIDNLGIGLEVDLDCRLLDLNGAPSARIRAIGPVSRAAFWEITAIPDIREQTADVARAIAADASASAETSGG